MISSEVILPPKIDAGEVFKAIASRRSMGLSRLSDQPVPREFVEQMLQAADWAPSHGDTEPWRFQVFMGEGRVKLAEIFGRGYLATTDEPDPEKLEAWRNRAFAAPLWITIGMVPEIKPDGSMKMTIEEELMATASAVQNLHLMATALGLTGLWHSKGISVNKAVARQLGIEEPGRLLGMFMCGFPKTDWPQGERRPLDSKVIWHTR